MENLKGADPKKLVVFFDFDNTITTFDVLDDMLIRFSKDNGWERLEERWKSGEIGSRECLKGQMEGIRVTKGELDSYLSKIEIDPAFKKITKFLRAINIKPIILSDNFAYIISRILQNNDIKGLDVYSNRLSVAGGRLKSSFPFTNRSCGECAHCKQTTLRSNVGEGQISVYVGDGKSDVCASGEADIVFAKGYLKKYLTDKKRPCVPFDRLKEVYKYLLDNMER